jgi:RNA polymerase sigma-70 factor, ECF subfamily
MKTEQSLSRDASNVATQFELRPSLVDWPSVSGVPEQERSDADLVRAAQKGDRGAFGELYIRYAGMVHGILLARVPEAAAEDLVQEVFLLVLPRLASLRDVLRFGGWLAAIARNRAADFHRQARPCAEFNEELPGRETENDSMSRDDQAEARAILDAVRALPEAYRETLILRLVEGMTGPEIAARTGLTHGSVRVNLHRGMQQLRKRLGRDAKPDALSESAP